MSFNPELDSDDTYKRLVISPPPNAVVVKTSWRDNPDLSEELRVEIEHLKATDPDECEHVYEGMCRQSVTRRARHRWCFEMHVYRNAHFCAITIRPERNSSPASLPFVIGTFASALDGVKLRSLWQSLKVYKEMPGQNPQSRKTRRNRLASTPFTTERGFTLESRTTSNINYSDIGAATMLVSQVPFRPASCLKSAIRMSDCDGRWP